MATADFNSYGTRRGNHEVMVRGTFANIRLRNQMAPGTEGGVTVKLPEGTEMSIFDASTAYASREHPADHHRRQRVRKRLEPRLGGQRHQVARRQGRPRRELRRIHRSNLVGMGVLPLQFLAGESARTYDLDGTETSPSPDSSRSTVVRRCRA